MKLAAIIAEYNPFHNGHLYHIEETRRQTGADGIVVLMSGCFVQRGEPAIFDKFLRTRMALDAGADLVLELPTVFACGSAEYFAEGAIRLLNGLNAISYLSFGCEYDRLADIRQLAHILCKEPDIYRETLQTQLKSGSGFAAARAAALKSALPVPCPAGLDSLLSAPNAVLALEYCKALERTDSRIAPVLIPRRGSGYHETNLDGQALPSATAIRSALACGRTLSELKDVLPQLPPENNPDFLRPLFADDASVLLNDRIAALTADHDILDLSPELTARILKLRRSFYTWTEWCQALKTKQYAYTRISRSLCHILLDIRRSDAEMLRRQPSGAYARILGLRRDSAVPAFLRQSAQLPLITKLADYERCEAVSAHVKKNPALQDSPPAAGCVSDIFHPAAVRSVGDFYTIGNEVSYCIKKQLATDLRARNLYRLLYWQKYQKNPADEYASGIIIR